ncbi:hypothetical protein [Ruegeria sp.]|uniref:hypothetical protein n=1 Tax=Ruegeria sp. TaxID=1879320 RepID=UPI003B5926FE
MTGRGDPVPPGDLPGGWRLMAPHEQMDDGDVRMVGRVFLDNRRQWLCFLRARPPLHFYLETDLTHPQDPSRYARFTWEADPFEALIEHLCKEEKR